jgi:predicted amino acid racemase
MAGAELHINLDKITENSQRVLESCRTWGIDVVGVIKGVCGLPHVARAVLEGGIKTLGDSRLENIARLRENGIDAPIELIRSPALSEVEQCISLVNRSLISDITVLKALNKSVKGSKTHNVILMVDFDTGREGLNADDLGEAIQFIFNKKGLRLAGLGVYFLDGTDDLFINLGLKKLCTLARELETKFNINIPVISGGSSNAYHMFLRRNSPIPGINQLRIGTAILLGLSTSVGPARVEGLHSDTCLLKAEITELKSRGGRLIGILGVGLVDTVPELVFPVKEGIKVMKLTSDHTLVDFTGLTKSPSIGEKIEFTLGYQALTRLILSPYVSITYEKNKTELGN